jgi:hypothetical protein
MIALRHATAPAAAPNDINLLASGVLKSMSASKLKTVAAMLVVVLLVGGGLAHLSGQQEDGPDTPGTGKASPMNAANPGKPSGDWSKAVNGLQVRVVLVEKPRSNGTRMLHPYLELRNVDDMAYPLKVRLGGARHVRFDLVDADGKVVGNGVSLPRGGPHPDPGTITLPLDSSLRVGMYCTNWGIPRGAAAMIATDSGAWVLKPEQAGKVFLRATVSGKKDAGERVWSGDLDAQVRVTWSGDGAKIEEPKATLSWADLLLPREVAAGQFEKWQAAIDPNARATVTYTYTRVEYAGKAFWVTDAHYGDGVAYKCIGVYAPEKDGSFHRVLVADSNRAGWLAVSLDQKTGMLELRERANSTLKDAVVLSCNLKTVGTAHSTGVAP